MSCLGRDVKLVMRTLAERRLKGAISGASSPFTRFRKYVDSVLVRRGENIILEAHRLEKREMQTFGARSFVVHNSVILLYC